MNSVPILDEEAVLDVLVNLSRDEVVRFRETLSQTLQDYSVGGEAQFQPTPGHVTRPDGQKSLFRSFTSADAVGVKIIVDPAPPPAGSAAAKDPLHGAMVICDSKGYPSGVLSAEQLTGFRTAMSALMALAFRARVRRVLVFGAGLQALWHARLLLLLRGDELQSITVVNRSRARAEALVARVTAENAARWQSACVVTSLDAAAADHAAVLRDHFATADAVFCTVPSKTPLFPASYITERPATSSGWPYISAIGAWMADMIELDPALLQFAVQYDGAAHPIVVDDAASVMVHTGEMAQSKLARAQTVEIGRLLAIKAGRAPALEAAQAADADEWLSKGLVVYKSVGIGLTDLTTAKAVIDLAKKKQEK